MGKLYRARFVSDSEDPRPVSKVWPIKWPYWISGYDSNDNYIIIAYVDSKKTLLKLWPEAQNIDMVERDEIKYTSRFPMPDYLKPGFVDEEIDS